MPKYFSTDKCGISEVAINFLGKQLISVFPVVVSISPHDAVWDDQDDFDNDDEQEEDGSGGIGQGGSGTGGGNQGRTSPTRIISASYYDIKIYAIDRLNIEAANRIISSNQFLADIWFTDKIFSTRSEVFPSVDFICGENTCGSGYFEIPSSVSSGYECFPYPEVFTALEEINKYLKSCYY
jgi:hypothetical protein